MMSRGRGRSDQHRPLEDKLLIRLPELPVPWNDGQLLSREFVFVDELKQTGANVGVQQG